MHKIMNNLTLIQKLSLNIALAIIIFCAVAALSIRQYQNMEQGVHLLSDVNIPVLVGLQEMYAQGLQTEQATRNVVLNPADKTARANYEKADAKFKQDLDTAQQLATGAMAESLKPLPQLWSDSSALKTKLIHYFMAQGELSGDEAFAILRGEGSLRSGGTLSGRVSRSWWGSRARSRRGPWQLASPCPRPRSSR